MSQQLGRDGEAGREGVDFFLSRIPALFGYAR
jgi:hypothetical protein